MVDKKNNYFSAEHAVGSFLLEWQEDLENNKADRAKLKRCKSLSEVELTSAFQRVYWKLIRLFDEPKKVKKEQCAIIIALAAQVEKNVCDPPGTKSDDQRQRFGYQIAQGSEGPKLHELRFRRLLRAEDRDRLFEVLVKIIRLMKREINLLDILAVAFYWGDKTRKRLAYQYYEKAKLEK